MIVAEKMQRKRGAMCVMAYSRKPERQGFVEVYFDFAEPDGIMACQAVEGGIYYLAGDQKLHFLAGTGKK